MTWDDLLTHDNLRLAWKRIRNSSITTTKDRLGLKIFSQSLDIHINQLIQDLSTDNYSPTPSSILYLPKKSGRLRPFTLLHMRDRLVYQAIGNILIDNTYKYLLKYADRTVFSPVLARPDGDYVFFPSLKRGESFEGQFIKFMTHQASIVSGDQFQYVVNTDIASFYPSIDHSLLLQKLASNNWLDTKIVHLLQRCLRIWSANDVNFQLNKGLPIGYESSDLLANLFLSEIDEIFDDYRYLRYVDDIRIFVASEERGEYLLRQLELHLKKHGLELQSSKTTVSNLSHDSIVDRLRSLTDQQDLLSSIDRDLNSPNEFEQQEVDQRLLNIMAEVLGIEDYETFDLNERIEPTEETSLFFALYRLREKHILVRDMALELLISHPHRSYAIVKYLTLFNDDSVVIEKLWEVVNDNSKHGEVRANCLRALYELTEDLVSIKMIINKWLYSSDLSLSFCAIELSQKYPEDPDIIDLLYLSENADKHILYSAISTRFLLIDSNEEKMELISHCANQNDYMLKSLSFYFLSTNTHLLSDFANEESDLVKNLIEDFEKRVSVNNVIQNLSRLFNLDNEFSQNLSSLASLSELNQSVINMTLSIETNRDEYLRNLTEFLVGFSRLYQNITDKEFSSLINSPDISEAFTNSERGLMDLSDFRSSETFLGTRPALSYIDSQKLHEGIASVMSQALSEIDDFVKEMLSTGLEEIVERHEAFVPMIFFSYSHDDEKKRKKLKKQLKYLETRGLAALWSDRKIPAGQVWSKELDEKLNEANIVLFLITSNFMGSDFIHKKEMPRAINNHNSQKTVCIPVLLEDCDWEFEPYKSLQAIPEDAKPITRWTRPDSAYKDIQQKVREVLDKIKDGTFVWRVIDLDE